MTRPLPDLANDRLGEWAGWLIRLAQNETPAWQSRLETIARGLAQLSEQTDVIQLVHDLFDSTRPTCDTCGGTGEVPGSSLPSKIGQHDLGTYPCPDPFCDHGQLDMGEHLRRITTGREITGETSDGYHTFRELYEYRLLYNAGMLNALALTHPEYEIHKSWRHSDGELCFGGDWFIVVAQLPTGQVSNHYKLDEWHLFQVDSRERAASWDGHDPAEAARRLRAFVLLRQLGRQP